VRGSPRLEVVVSSRCAACAESLRLIAVVRAAHPGANISVVDLDRQPPAADSPAVPGTPTWLVDGAVWSLGNPDHAQLLALLGGGGPA